MTVQNLGVGDALEVLAFESVARLMTIDVLVIAPSDTAESGRARMLRKHYECLRDIAVYSRKVKGLLKLEDVLAPPEDEVVSRNINTDPPVVKHGVDQDPLSILQDRRDLVLAVRYLSIASLLI